MKYIPRYQAFIQSLKGHGYTVLGYARKSPSAEGKEKRTELLDKTVRCLKNRSLVEKVFVSPWCSAGDPLASRDLTGIGALIKNLESVNGNTQGKYMLLYTKYNIDKYIIHIFRVIQPSLLYRKGCLHYIE